MLDQGLDVGAVVGRRGEQQGAPASGLEGSGGGVGAAAGGTRHTHPLPGLRDLDEQVEQGLGGGDLVVLAAEWGSGRRKGWLSNLHLGARDPTSGEFVMLGKTFKGLTDALLAWQTEALLARETRREDYVVHVRPELVVEIAFNDIQRSPHYPAGMALRFARVKRYREDKRPEQADTIDAVREIHRRQFPD